MPPEISPCHPSVTPTIQFLPQDQPHRSPANHLPPPRLKHNRGTKTMTITKKKLILILVFALSGLSILRLLKISAIASFYSPPPVAAARPPRTHRQPVFSTSSNLLTEKEYRLLSNLISLRAPCNILVFGLEQQYLNLSRINAGGNTVFLDDNPEKLSTIKTDHNNSTTRIYRVEYKTIAGDAYKLLKNARENPACGMLGGSLRKSGCPLALKKLPKEVYKNKWDVVVVDGPRGDAPDAPGRMGAIYTASVMARAGGNTTDVVVHDVDRTIEKWFAWEFLCHENLVSSKGKLWNFRIEGKSNSTSFCSEKTIPIV